MANKLSDSKISKIIEYKNAGYSQHYTAAKLHINQSTACHYWNKFDDYAKAEGLEAATGKYGGGDATDLNALAAELKKENLSIPEAKAGLKVHQLLQKLEVPLEDYEGVIKACLKINEKCFLETAAELEELEEKLGDSGLGVISGLELAAKKLEEAHSELDQLYLLIKSTKKELEGLKEQKKAAEIYFEQRLKYLGLTLHRLELVEHLSMALKKAGISDETIETYLKRQGILNEAKLEMALFVSVVTQAKVVTALDGGQGFLGSLKEYGSLTAANVALGVKQKTLKESIVGLQAQAELKGKLQGEVVVLAAEKTALEPYLEKLQASKEQYDHFQSKIAELVKSSSILVEQSQQRLQEKLELEEKKKRREDEWQSFEGFVALVREQPLKGLELFSAVLPCFIEGVNKGQYKAVTVRNEVVKKLTGTDFKLPMCCTCTNKPVKIEPPKPKNMQVIPISIEVIEGTESSWDPGIGA
jgi:hypothetical protein